MELDALKFTVETTALDEAITKVGTLQLAVKKLGAETVAPKVIKADNIVSKDAEERVTKLNNVLERQQDILAFMASGFSKGQASVLAFGKTAGLATDQLKLLGDVLDTQRKLIGGDTFDKSNSALKALQNQYALLKDAARAYNDESSLTQKQLQGLGLDKERLLEKYKIEGKSLSDIKSALRDLNTEYNKAAISVNQQVAANTKLAESSRKTAAGQELANKALAKADEMLARLQNRTKEMSKESPVSATAANQLYAYEKALKAAGVGATEATARLAVFRAEQQKVSQLARSEETLRMQHLSRALAPQVTDVTVGLMTGQNPFTVFLQQGGQIRDQIGLSQVAVENLGKVFKDTFVMMGGMIAAMGKALYAFFMTPIGAAVLAFTAFAVSVYKAAGAMLEAERSTLVLNKALELNASNIGKTISSMQNLSAEVSSVSTITNTQASTAISELSKTSAIADENFVKATISAINFERYAGVAVSETVNMYKEIGKDPIKALLKLQEETGRLNVIQVEHIETLIKQGEKEKAAAELSKYMADSQANSADRIKESLTGMSRAVDKAHDDFIAFGKWFSKPFETKTLETLLKEAEDKLFTSLQNQQKMKRLFGFSFGTEKEQADVDVLAGSVAFNNALSSQKQLQKERTDGEAALLALRLKYADKVDSREAARTEAKLALEKRLKESINMSPEDIAKATESYGKTLELINRKEKKPKEEKSDSLSFSLTNDTAQARKQYDIQLKDQTDFVNQQKQRLDNSLAAKEISQGEYIAREIALVMKGEAEQSKIIEDSMVKEQENYAKDRASLTQQYKDWQAENKGMPDFVDVNKQKAEELQSKLGDLTNTFNSATEKLMASSDKVKETAFTRMIKQISELKGAIREVILEREKFQRSEDEFLSKQKRQTAIEDKLRYASPEQAAFIQAQTQEQERLNAVIKVYNEELAKADINLKGYNAALASETDPDIIKFQKEQIVLLEAANEERRKSIKLVQETASGKSLAQGQAAQLKYQKDQMKALSDSIAGAIEVGLYEGGDAGSKALRKIIEAELRKPITIFIKAVVGSLTSGLTGVAGAASSDSNILGTASNAYSAYGSLAGGAAAFTGAFSAGAAVGMEAFSAGATMMAEASGISSFMAGAGQALGAIGPVGWAALAAVAAMSLMGGNFTSASSTGYSNKAFSETGAATDRLTTSAGAGNIVDALYADYAKKAESLGITKAATKFEFSSNTGREGQNPNFTIQASAGGKSYVTQTDNPGLFGANEIAMNDANMQLQASRAILTALQGSELPKYLKGAFDTLVTSSMDSTAINATFEAASALKLFHDQLQLLPFESLKDLSYTATEALKTFSGGLEALGTNLGTYYDKFYSEEEKTALLTKNTKKAFEDLGQVMPVLNDSTRATYRALVDELAAKDLSIAKNAAAYAGVLQLSGAIDKLAPSLTDSAAAITEFLKSGESIYKWLKNLNTSALGLGSPQEQLTTSKSSYISSLSGSRLGDKNSLSNLTADAESYLQAAMDISSTQQQYKAILAQVKTEVSNVPAVLSYQQQLVTSANTALVLAQQQNALLYSIASSTASLAGTPAPSLLSNTATGGATLVTSGVSSGVNSAQVQATSDLVLAAIRDELIGMRYEVRAGVEAGTKTAKILTRVSRDGEEVQVQTGAVFNLPA